MERKCIRCNLNIHDETMECPLCHGVLEMRLDEESVDISDAAHSVTYPDISSSIKTMQFIIRLVIFAAIVSEIVVMIVNYFTFKGVYWSLIVGVGLIYGCFTLLYSVKERKSIQRIIQVQMLLAILVLVALDNLTGSTGWSYKYALPILFTGVDIGVVVLMIIGIDGWQSYIMTEIVTFILSIILVILHFTGILVTTVFAAGALLITGLILLGTVMLGSRMVSNELKRRFQI